MSDAIVDGVTRQTKKGGWMLDCSTCAASGRRRPEVAAWDTDDRGLNPAKTGFGWARRGNVYEETSGASRRLVRPFAGSLIRCASCGAAVRVPPLRRS